MAPRIPKATQRPRTPGRTPPRTDGEIEKPAPRDRGFPPLRRRTDEDDGTQYIEDNNIFPHPFRRIRPTQVKFSSGIFAPHWTTLAKP